MSKFDGMTNAMDNWQWGMRDGLPLGIAYFAVSFAFGMFASNKGFSILDTLLVSVTNITSAGQFTGVTMIMAGCTYIDMVMTQLVLNLRYLIMSTSLSQKYDSDLPLIHRMICSFPITDEIFGLISCRESKVSPFYTYGIMTMALPSWALGTLCGAYSGTLLSKSVSSALGIVIYSLFIAMLTKPAEKDKTIRYVVFSALCLGMIISYLPYLNTLSPGIKIIIITVIVSSIAAIIKPINDDDVLKEETESYAMAREEAMSIDWEDDDD